MRYKGFTLLELLIVIGIIGLLSGIAFVRVNDAREKARVASGLSFHQSIHQIVGANISSRWGFDNLTSPTVPDISGSEFSGTHRDSLGVATIPTLVTGVVDDAIDLRGVNEYVDVGIINDLNIYGDLTLSAWININNIIPGQTASIVEKGSGTEGDAARNDIFVMAVVDGGDVRYHHESDTGLTNHTHDFDTNLLEDTWYHIAIVREDVSPGGGEVRLYIDGQQFSDVYSYTTDPAGGINSPVNIGRSQWNFYFDGMVDEVSVYDQTATVAQIQKLYAEGFQKIPIAQE